MGCCKLAHSVRLTMVPSHGYTGYGAFTWIHWLWCLHMSTLAMVPSHGYTGYGAFTWIHWLWCLHMDNTKQSEGLVLCVKKLGLRAG